MIKLIIVPIVILLYTRHKTYIPFWFTDQFGFPLAPTTPPSVGALILNSLGTQNNPNELLLCGYDFFAPLNNPSTFQSRLQLIFPLICFEHIFWHGGVRTTRERFLRENLRNFEEYYLMLRNIKRKHFAVI